MALEDFRQGFYGHLNNYIGCGRTGYENINRAILEREKRIDEYIVAEWEKSGLADGATPKFSVQCGERAGKIFLERILSSKEISLA